MFLQPSEVGFLKHLKEARVPVVEFDFPAKRIVNVQSQLEKLIGQNYYLNKVSLDIFQYFISGVLSTALPNCVSPYLSATLSRTVSVENPHGRTNHTFFFFFFIKNTSPPKTDTDPTCKLTPHTRSAPSLMSTNSISSK